MLKICLSTICVSLAVCGLTPLQADMYSQQSNGKQGSYSYQQQQSSQQNWAQSSQPPGSSQIQWHTNFNQAMQLAQKERKPIVLFFTGSDWCGWCKKMHQEIFASSEFAQAAGNQFIFVEIDFPRGRQLSPEMAQQNEMLKQKYGITGFPTVILLDSNGNFIAETGYMPGGGRAFAAYLKQQTMR